MPLQNQVSIGLPAGVPGSKASFGPTAYYPNNLIAETAVIAGNFVWLGTDPEIKAVGSGSDAPIGIVERNIIYHNFDLASEGSLLIPEGSGLAIAVRGSFWATSSTDAAVGQKVFASETDGGISTGDAGDTVSGAVETSWTVTTGGEAGEPIIISNWSS